jgi:hypothetical protein
MFNANYVTFAMHLFPLIICANQVAEHASQQGLPDNMGLIHVCDSDSMYHVNYFSATNYFFLTAKEEERRATIWQSPVVG